ncbi:MAG: hypothetical protein JXB32_03935 [Deltaproteobacteria bacterium]|nr:hypothetical protein [Deltaproteobacteria bacterium]
MRIVPVSALAVTLAVGLGVHCGADGADPCAGVTCSSRGFCLVDQGTAYCGCIAGYRPEGLACAPIDPSDPCAGVDCSGHGACVDVSGDPTCDCETGYHRLTEDDPRCAGLECDLICVADHPSDGGGDADADADADAEADADADAEADADADAEADADADAAPACTCTDDDGDGYYPTTCADPDCSPRTDCDDGRRSVHPGADELCGNGLDDDCVGGDMPCSPDCTCTDGDEDGYYPTTCGDPDCSPRTDCDDARRSVHPGAVELCGNGLDDDCVGGDEACPSDETPPTIAIAAIADPAPGDYDATATVSFTWSCDDDDSGCARGTQACTVDSIATGVTCGWGTGSAAVGATGSFAFGSHTLVVTARDAAGNLGTATRTFTVTRCAGDLQFPNRRSDGFVRGDCCTGLEVSDWYDFMLGFWHPRGDASCRPHADYLSRDFESMWGAGGCVDGSTTYDLLQGAGLPGCASYIARAVCLDTVAQAQLYCGTDGGSGTQTPWHGRAAEGWHPPASAGCVHGVMSSSLMMERLGATNVCFTAVDRGSDRMSVYPTDACGTGLGHYCRSPEGTLPDDPPLCVCSASDPYADDGRN